MKKDETPLVEKNDYEPRNLKILRRLVTVLTLIMILGFIAISSVILISFTKKINKNNVISLPETISLDSNEKVVSITYHQEVIILLLELRNGTQKIRTVSSKTGKIISDTVVISKE